jgi:hypothetical protein
MQGLFHEERRGHHARLPRPPLAQTLRKAEDRAYAVQTMEKVGLIDLPPDNNRKNLQAVFTDRGRQCTRSVPWWRDIPLAAC